MCVMLIPGGSIERIGYQRLLFNFVFSVVISVKNLDAAICFKAISLTAESCFQSLYVTRITLLELLSRGQCHQKMLKQPFDHRFNYSELIACLHRSVVLNSSNNLCITELNLRFCIIKKETII